VIQITSVTKSGHSAYVPQSGHSRRARSVPRQRRSPGPPRPADLGAGDLELAGGPRARHLAGTSSSPGRARRAVARDLDPQAGALSSLVAWCWRRHPKPITVLLGSWPLDAPRSPARAPRRPRPRHRAHGRQFPRPPPAVGAVGPPPMPQPHFRNSPHSQVPLPVLPLSALDPCGAIPPRRRYRPAVLLVSGKGPPRRFRRIHRFNRGRGPPKKSALRTVPAVVGWAVSKGPEASANPGEAVESEGRVVPRHAGSATTRRGLDAGGG
jgi:hypothetical protein